VLWEGDWASALGLEGRLHGVTEDYILGGKGAGLVVGYVSSGIAV